MEKEFFIRPYVEGDENEIVPLLQIVFEGWPFFDLNCTPLDHWRWKIVDNPYDYGVIVCAVNDGKIIGCSHIIPGKIKIGDEIFSSSYGTDFGVHPDYRGKGVSTAIRDYVKVQREQAGIYFQYLATENPIVYKSRSVRKIFQPFPHRISYLQRIKDLSTYLKRREVENPLRMRLKFQIERIMGGLRNLFSSKYDIGNIEISNVDSFDDRADDFWNKIKDYYDFIVARDKKYLNWRFCDPRGGAYSVRIAEEDGVMLGYSVLRVNYLKEYPLGYVVDFLALPERFDVAKALIGDAIRFFDDLEMNIIEYQEVENHPYCRFFKKYGFIDAKRECCLFFTWVKGEKHAVKDLSANRIHFPYGDLTGI